MDNLFENVTILEVFTACLIPILAWYIKYTESKNKARMEENKANLEETRESVNTQILLTDSLNSLYEPLREQIASQQKQMEIYRVEAEQMRLASRKQTQLIAEAEARHRAELASVVLESERQAKQQGEVIEAMRKEHAAEIAALQAELNKYKKRLGVLTKRIEVLRKSGKIGTTELEQLFADSDKNEVK